MSSMVLTQLLNPDSGADRAIAGKTAESGSQGRAETGPSRYDEVVRQQEKRLEQRRAEEQALQQRRQEDIRRADRDQEKAATSKLNDRTPGEDSARAASDRRTERTERPERTGNSGRAEKADRPEHSNRPSDHARAEQVREEESGTPELVSADLMEALDADVAGLIEPEIPLTVAGPMKGIAADARSAAQAMASLTATGRPPGATPTVGTLFAAMLETGNGSTGKSGDLLTGLQGNAQLAAESSGKFADTLANQLTTRLSAPELSQPLNQAASLRGPEAQALMRSYSTSVDVPVGADEWGDKVMGKLAWLTASQMSVAEIHITPPELGPIDVRVQVQNDQATVTVHATTPAVREQLELHGHRLRDMLSEQGLNLEGFDVTDSAGRQASDQSGDGDNGSGRESAASAPDATEGDIDTELMASGALDLSWKGEVDLYA